MRVLAALALLLALPAAAQTGEDDVIAFASADSLLAVALGDWRDVKTPVAEYDTLLNVLLPTMEGALLGHEPRTGDKGGLRPLGAALPADGAPLLFVTPVGPRPDLELGDEVSRLGFGGRCVADEYAARGVAVAFDGRGTFTDDLFGPALVVILGDALGRGAYYITPIEGEGYDDEVALGVPFWAFSSSLFTTPDPSLWAGLKGGRWPALPSDIVEGRLATLDDVAAGRAAFTLGTTGPSAAAPSVVTLPQYALLLDDGVPVPGVVFQAEEAFAIRSAAFQPAEAGRQPQIVLLDTLVLLGDLPPAPGK